MASLALVAAGRSGHATDVVQHDVALGLSGARLTLIAYSLQ